MSKFRVTLVVDFSGQGSIGSGFFFDWTVTHLVKNWASFRQQSVSKNVNNKKHFPKLMIFFQKDSMIFDDEKI